jgi:hypothetical protein
VTYRRMSDNSSNDLRIGTVVATAAVMFTLCLPAFSEPVAVRHVQGYIHGFLVLQDLNNKILASGDITQTPAGNEVTAVFRLRFKDGSLYEETSVFSQRQVYRLLRYKEIQKGPSFKTGMTVSLDTGSGTVNIQDTDKDGKEKTIAKRLSLPSDLANGIITTLLNDVDTKKETTLSMLVFTPEPRVVKLRISAVGQDAFSVGGFGSKANHYVVKIDIGGVSGVVAKIAGKQPPPIQMWVAGADAPVFLKSEGPLYEDGPIWRIELASPTWPSPLAPRARTD